MSRGEDREANGSQREVLPGHFGFESVSPVLVRRMNKAIKLPPTPTRDSTGE